MFLFLKKLFGATVAIWLNRNGHDLHWPVDDVPVNVYLDTSLLDQDAHTQERAWYIAANTSRLINLASGARVLLMPVTAERETLVQFEASRATVFQAVLVRALPWHGASDQSVGCNADARDDERTGAIRSVEINWWVTGRDGDDCRSLLHEYGHALGLAHLDGTVMSARLQSGVSADFSESQRSALRARYGRGVK